MFFDLIVVSPLPRRVKRWRLSKEQLSFDSYTFAERDGLERGAEHQASMIRGPRLVQPPGGMSQLGAMLKDNARPQPQPMERADRQAFQHGVQPPGGRSSFAFDDYAGQADDYLGRTVPRQQHRRQFMEQGAHPPGGHSNVVFDDDRHVHVCQSCKR